MRENKIMKKNPFIAALWCLVVGSIFPLHTLDAQDLISLYKDFLPQEILGNADFSRMVSATLTSKSSLHPDLIFFEIKRLGSLYLQSDRTVQRQTELCARNREASLKARKRQWLLSQSLALAASEPDYEIRERCLQYLEPGPIETSLSDTPTPCAGVPDTNLMNYFTLVFLTNDTSLHYEAGFRYSDRRDKSMDSVMGDFVDRFASMAGGSPGNRDDFIESLVQHWYIFEDCSQRIGQQKPFRDVYQMIDELVRGEYSTGNIPSITVGAGYAIINSIQSVSFALPVAYATYFSYAPQSATYPNPEVKTRPDIRQVSALVGYKLPLRQSLGFCSYLNLQGMVSFSLKTTAYQEQSHSSKRYLEGAIDIYEDVSSTQNVSVRTLNTFTLRAGVPVIMVADRIYVELAGNVGLLHLVSDARFSYTMSRMEGYSAGSFFDPYYYKHQIALASGSGEVQLAKNYFVFFPSLEISGTVMGGFRLRSVLGLDYLSVLGEYEI